MAARFVMVDDDDRGGGFDLLLGERVILSHRVDAPAFSIAKGKPDVTMVRGNFRMDDTPSEIFAPRRATLSDDGCGQRIDFRDLDLPHPELSVFLTDDGHLLVRTARSAGYDRLTIRFVRRRDEVIWGGGEQMSHLVLNGRTFPMWTSEPGVGREPGTPLTDRMNADGSFAGGDYWTTNYPQPSILLSGGSLIIVNNSCYGEIDCRASDGFSVSLWSAAADVSLLSCAYPADAVAHLATRWASAPTPLPDWAVGGAIVGLKDGTKSFDRLDRIIAAGAAVSGLWCEDWVGVRETSFGRRLFWDWQWNASRYPDLPRRMAELKARGIRFLGYVNPYLAVDGPQYAEAARLGYLAMRIDSDEPYAVDFGEFEAGVVDFTNKSASDWFAEEVIGKHMLDFGLDGWMADFGEYLPVDLRLHDGDPMDEHNRWPVHWAAVNHRAVQSRDRADAILWFMRAGFSGVSAYCPLLWAGDQSVDFSRHDGIGTVITAALSAGLAGMPFSHSDVGGYTSLHGNVRTAELLHRWYELGAFTPAMRTHEGNRPDDNLQIDSTPELLRGFARWSRVHAALAPWVRQLGDDAVASGLPAQRALFLHYPDDRETFHIQDQYLYGADLMVAPVIEEGAVQRRVYLPGAPDVVWRHIWTGADRAPGWHDVPAPIGAPPVFYRPDSGFADLFASLVATRDSL